jgi:hypothetical protein
VGARGVTRDQVLRSTRIVAAVIVPFLLLAFAVLFPFPDQTSHHFAWDIKPSMSAMVLGSVYLGGAYFFVRVTYARRWHEIAGGFVPVATFATLMGVATILHWDRFRHGTAAFGVWTALYFTTPVIVVVIFLMNRRVEGSSETGLELPRPAAAFIVVGACLSTLMSAALYLFPDRLLTVWPWHLTELTARMLGAIFALGIAGFGVVRDRRWTSARILAQVAMIMLALILVSAIRAHAEFDRSRALTWLFAAGFIITLFGAAGLYTRMELRAR